MGTALTLVFVATGLSILITAFCEYKIYMRDVRTVYRCAGLDADGKYFEVGPFTGKHAADRFAANFNSAYKGFLVVDGARIPVPDKERKRKGNL